MYGGVFCKNAFLPFVSTLSSDSLTTILHCVIFAGCLSLGWRLCHCLTAMGLDFYRTRCVRSIEIAKLCMFICTFCTAR